MIQDPELDNAFDLVSNLFLSNRSVLEVALCITTVRQSRRNGESVGAVADDAPEAPPCIGRFLELSSGNQVTVLF